jgi:hypothetical protein
MTGIRQSWTALVLAIAALASVALAFGVAAVVLAEGIPPEGWGYSPADISLQLSVQGGAVPTAALVIAGVLFAASALQRTTFRAVRVRSIVSLGVIALAVLLGVFPTVVYLMLP